MTVFAIVVAYGIMMALVFGGLLGLSKILSRHGFNIPPSLLQMVWLAFGLNTIVYLFIIIACAIFYEDLQSIG